MISVVTVYNDYNTLSRILLPSLSRQISKHQLIMVDNTGGRFKSAAEALNYGGGKATGDYIMFTHQDVELASDTWLMDVENVLLGLKRLGIAGPVGVGTQGGTYEERIRGFVCNAGMDMGAPFVMPQEVQTLDECVLIVPRVIFSTLRFDARTFDGWHCYGADYCLTVQDRGLKAYAIPAYVYHRSLITNTRDLWEYQRRLYRKHRRTIYTTCGTVSRLRCLATPLLSMLFKFYYHHRKDWMGIVKKELKGCNTVLDIGCGYNSPLQHCRDGRYMVGVDAYEPYLIESKMKAIHNEYVKGDLRWLQFPDNSFDAVFCSEVIEHLTKTEGHILIEKMSKWAKQKVIITTPNGYVKQEGEVNPWQAHRSGWSINELKALEFDNIKGMGGLKMLRDGDNAEIKYKPLYLFAALSVASQAVTDSIPSLAFQMLAIKNKNH